TIPLQQLNGLETLVIIMVANKYAFLQITRRRFLNEWEAFKKVISRRNIRRRWLDLVASLPLIKERILVIILLLHFLSLMLGSVLVLMLPLLVWLTPDLRIKKILLKCNWTIRKRL